MAQSCSISEVSPDLRQGSGVWAVPVGTERSGVVGGAVLRRHLSTGPKPAFAPFSVVNQDGRAVAAFGGHLGAALAVLRLVARRLEVAPVQPQPVQRGRRPLQPGPRDPAAFRMLLDPQLDEAILIRDAVRADLGPSRGP